MEDTQRRAYKRPVVVQLGAPARGTGQCQTGQTNLAEGCLDGGANASGECFSGSLNYGLLCSMGTSDTVLWVECVAGPGTGAGVDCFFGAFFVQI